MKFLWKGKAHRKTETEANRFGLRFLYFTAGRENNQLEHFSNDRKVVLQKKGLPEDALTKAYLRQLLEDSENLTSTLSSAW